MYYVYRHIRLDKQEVFYIGVGTIPSEKQLNKLGRTHKALYHRAYSTKKSRNPHWINIINKTDYQIEIIFESNDINVIKMKEKEFIRLYKNTLCNLTEGGDGIEGYNHTEETKLRIGSTLTGRKHSKERIEKTNQSKFKKIIMIDGQDNKTLFDSITNAARFLGVKDISNISSCLRGKRLRSFGYTFKYQENAESEDKEPQS